MKYKIIVDKQPRTNPSSEKHEYEIDIEELRCKGDVADSLVITKDEDYVMRRLSLSEYHVLSVLSEPVKEPLESINIKLFEGENYIYLFDVVGNKLYAEYLVKNDFTDMYVTTNQMNSAINETAGKIELSVNQKLMEYATSEELEGAVTELNGTIETKAGEISQEVSKKVNEETITGAYLILKINGDTSEAKLNADKIELSANDILNLLAGNAINLTSKNIIISSTGFNVDKNGKITITDQSKDGEPSEAFLTVESSESDWITDILSGYINLSQYKNSATGHSALLNPFSVGIGYSSDGNAIEYGCDMHADEQLVQITVFDQNNTTKIKPSSITTPILTQVSLKSKKKNIKKLKANALKLVKDADICEYNFKKEKKGSKKHLGLVIGEGYNCPNEVINEKGEGIEQYSMTSLLWKAVQELTAKVEKLEQEAKNGKN